MIVITALATPFKKGRVDWPSYERLLEAQGEADGVLCLGTTAEQSFLTEREKTNLVKIAKNALPNGKIWVGLPQTDTFQAVKAAEKAQRLGAYGLLLPPPAFHKCTKKGFVLHALAVQSATNLPLMLYNAPGRCGYTLWQDALLKLPQNGFLLKDAGSDTAYAKALCDKMTVLCGNEEKLSEFVAAGAKGVVSVVSNAFVHLTKRVLNNYQTGTKTKENTLYEGLVKLLFSEINPIAVKYLLYRLGIFESYEMRLPLTSATPQTQQQLDNRLKDFAEMGEIL